ncbi:MAG: hypothetical protein WDW36_000765 [Sanguina aurantia]
MPSATRSVSSGLASLMQRPVLGVASRTSIRSFAMVTAAPPAKAAPVIVQEAHGFKLERQQFVKEYDSEVLFYRHQKTGAELISVLNSDENKTFGVVFRTPVDNSFGIPHILEHSVLCGSRKFPIKEPFVELMKGSLNTFLNAFTYPDRTCYPVASTNSQDFYNLVDVYLDAVLHPRCITDPKTFEQEGWHHELDSADKELSYKGVVFNEMKGVYSSPDSVFYRDLQQALFTDNTYRHDSGGDPTQIPQLKFEEFQEFHAKYYHPSNARIWFYGDDNPTKRLEILDAYLSEFNARPVDSAVVTQALRSEPRSITSTFASGDAGKEELTAYTAVSWVLSEESLSVETELGLGFLDYLMLGTAAAPLRKALNDSALGASVIGGGMDDDLKQATFSVGLKGVLPENVPKVEALVLEELERLAVSGFSPTAIEAAINTTEFSLRENNTGSFPRGLSLMLRAMGSWIYDRDPFQPIQWEDALQSFKSKLASGEDVFGPLIRKYLLENRHRVTLTMLPDSALAAQVEEQEKARLVAARSGMDDAMVADTVRLTQELKERQETPDTPEALTCMPSLQLSDIPTTITKVPTDVTALSGGSTLLTHDLFTNNVLYMEAALNLKPVPMELLPLIPLFCRSLTQMGTASETFVQLTERIGRKTGGLSIYPFTSPVRGQDQPISYIMLRGKAMGDKAGDLTDLMRDILTTARLDDKARFSQMVAETKVGIESSIVGSGQSYASKRLSAQRSTAGYVSEVMGGLTYLDYIRTLGKRVEEDWEGVTADLETIRKLLLQKSGSLINLTADTRTLAAAQPHVESLLASLPDVSGAAADWSGRLPRISEALVVPTQVNYVAKGANLYEDGGYELHGSSYVINKYLGTSWLWDRVRVVGGAYGGFCTFDSLTGMFQYLSYRDPNLLETVEAYDGTAAFLRTAHLGQEELTKAIIGTIGDVDSYQLPDAKGYSAMSRYMLGISDEERQMRREQILGTSEKDFRAFAEVLECAQAVNDKSPGFWEITKVL